MPSIMEIDQLLTKYSFIIYHNGTARKQKYQRRKQHLNYANEMEVKSTCSSHPNNWMYFI